VEQTIINWAFAAVGTLLGIVVKAVWDAIRELQEEDRKLADRVASIDLLVAGKYVTRDELERITDAIFRKLDAIAEKLDQVKHNGTGK